MACPICLTEYIEDNCLTSCNHNFCHDCLVKWLNTQTAICPICREIITYFDREQQRTRIISIVSNIENENVLFYIQKLRCRLNFYKLCVLIFGGLFLCNKINDQELIDNITSKYDECHNNSIIVNNYLNDKEFVSMFHNDHFSSCFIPSFFIKSCELNY